jgi:hypothetical protein
MNKFIYSLTFLMFLAMITSPIETASTTQVVTTTPITTKPVSPTSSAKIVTTTPITTKPVSPASSAKTVTTTPITTKPVSPASSAKTVTTTPVTTKTTTPTSTATKVTTKPVFTTTTQPIPSSSSARTVTTKPVFTTTTQPVPSSSSAKIVTTKPVFTTTTRQTPSSSSTKTETTRPIFTTKPVTTTSTPKITTTSMRTTTPTGKIFKYVCDFDNNDCGVVSQTVSGTPTIYDIVNILPIQRYDNWDWYIYNITDVSSVCKKEYFFHLFLIIISNPSLLIAQKDLKPTSNNRYCEIPFFDIIHGRQAYHCVDNKCRTSLGMAQCFNGSFIGINSWSTAFRREITFPVINLKEKGAYDLTFYFFMYCSSNDGNVKCLGVEDPGDYIKLLIRFGPFGRETELTTITYKNINSQVNWNKIKLDFKADTRTDLYVTFFISFLCFI